MAPVLERARSDAAVLAEAGFEAVLVENYQDSPFYPERVPAETVAAMAVCVAEVRRTVQVPVGVNVLRNDAESALAVAAAVGAAFVRVNVLAGVAAADQGWLTGRAHAVQRLRTRLCPEVAVLADLWVKHATRLPGSDLLQDAEDLVLRAGADALIVTGAGTGREASLDRAAVVRERLPEVPVYVGSGVRPETVGRSLAAAYGVIVGSSLCRHGRAGAGVDPERARSFVRAARGEGSACGGGK